MTTQTPVETTEAVKAPEEVVAPKQPVAVVAPKKPAVLVQTTAAAVEVNQFEALIAPLRANGTVDEKHVIDVMTSYIKNMAPGLPHDATSGVREQYKLWSVINHVLAVAPEHNFSKLWSVMVAFVAEHLDTVFSIRYAHRFTEYWPYGDASAEGFSEMMNLLTATAKYGKDQATKHVSINKAVKTGIPDTGRGRLMRFYQV